MRYSKILLVVFIGFLLSGCAVTAIRKHQPNFKNVHLLEKVKGEYRVKEVVSPDPGLQERLNSRTLSCRLVTFNTPSGLTLSDYLRAALSDELEAAKKRKDNGTPITLSVNQLESDTSGFNTGTWTLNFDYIVGSRKVNVQTVTNFESAYMADTACRNTANALTDAISANFKKFYEALE